LSGGGTTYCAITTDDALRCWGQNFAGELGLGNKGNGVGDAPGELPKSDLPVGFSPVQVVHGNQHTCVRSAAGKVRCWGGNSFGQLGYGNTVDLGDNPGELPTADVNVGGTAIDLSAGLEHNCVILNTGAVRCWGNNDLGQLGLGNKTVIGNGPGEMPPASVNLGGLATQLATGEAHTCALLDNGKVRCWGENNFGQLGLGNTKTIGDGPGEMPPADTQLGALALAIYGGTNANHHCVLLAGSQLRCWGLNSAGQLGIGSEINIGDNELPSSAPLTLYK
jgi:alpha-tubulin suppressor-like RCC1 family protein